MLRLLVAFLAVLACAGRAGAHSAPFSFLDLTIRDQVIDGVIFLHVEDVAHDLDVEPADRFLDAAFVSGERDRIIAVIAPRISLTSDGSLPIEWLDAVPSLDRHAVQVRFRIAVTRPARLTILTRMFPYDPVHQTFVNVYEDDELRHQMIFNAASSPSDYYTRSTQGRLAVINTFIPSGVRHILIGPDHILFLIALLLTGGSWRTLLIIVTAFTVGHSVTLSLAALAFVTIPARLIEPAIALSIIYVGADNLVRGDGRDVRAWAAFVFGLVHGFGFANVLREFGLPAEALGWSLFSFNVGVEIGQLAIVSLAATTLILIQRRAPDIGRRVAQVGSVVVIAAGVYWFVQRVFFPPV